MIGNKVGCYLGLGYPTDPGRYNDSDNEESDKAKNFSHIFQLNDLKKKRNASF